MWGFITCVLMIALGWFLGATFGLPPFGAKKEEDNGDEYDRVCFLSRLGKGDKIVIPSAGGYIKDTLTVVRNDSNIQAIELVKHEILGNTETLFYKDKRFKNVIDENIFVLKDKTL
jgi:hypothetical protein